MFSLSSYRPTAPPRSQARWATVLETSAWHASYRPTSSTNIFESSNFDLSRECPHQCARAARILSYQTELSESNMQMEQMHLLLKAPSNRYVSHTYLPTQNLSNLTVSHRVQFPRSYVAPKRATQRSSRYDFRPKTRVRSSKGSTPATAVDLSQIKGMSDA